MQLSSRILTALAVLILAVTVVAVRAGSPATVEAATGTIDVVNVGTCYTTDTDVFAVGDCKDGDGDYEVAGRDTITETGSVFATYAHDPKTAADDPRGVLMNSNLIKISIEDTGRDAREPVLLLAGNATVKGGDLDIIQKDFPGIDKLDLDDMRWTAREGKFGDAALSFDAGGVVSGITILKSPSETDPYKPMDVADDTLVSIYGTVTPAVGPAGALENLKGILTLDEDVGSGRVDKEGGDDTLTEVAPWISLRKAIPVGATVVVQYIVYHTSEFETLVGGESSTSYPLTANKPDFTKDEGTDSALLVEARSDGRDSNQNLWLYETSRFSGRYEGYLQLTDENGNDPTTDSKPTNWGLAVKNATGSDDKDGAAVLGVESGPVDIAYKDSDGKTQTLSILIDTVPPAVQIDTPAHKSEGQDTSPNFAGSYTDDNSGLRDDTFRLYVDHKADTAENGDSGIPALNLPVSPTDTGHGLVTAANAVVESRADYKGYSDTSSTFGVIKHTEAFKEQPATDPAFKVVEGDNYDDGALEGTFGDSVRISFADGDYNDTIDFHALVADVAGNIGFSDSDADGPRFINNLGEKSADRKGSYSVLGWYARHIFFLDETDPVIFEEQSVTGFYGVNDDDDPVANRSGVLVAFDRAVDPDSIGVDTFAVTLDPTGGAGSTGASGDVVDVDVEGRVVYLLLAEELASDATPSVDIASGQWVSDPAGNRLTGGRQAAFEVNDGITPQLTVSLSNGSGTGEGDEGPSKLTMNSIIVTIGTDEEISATPSLVVVCSNIAWDSDTTDKVTEPDKELSDLISQRSGALSTSNANFGGISYDCGYTNAGGDTRLVELQQVQSYSRPGLEWEYQWVNFSDPKDLKDGKLTVVAYARDRQSYASLKDRVDDAPVPADSYNWGAATAEFRYDTDLEDPEPTPGDGDTVTESRPFVLLNYTDKSTVSIDEFSVDGTAQEISALGDNRFLYWPESLGIATHTVSVTAVDAAGNEDPFEYSFKVAERDPFNLKLIAGWNAVSFPANPVDPMIGDVFTEDAVDMVAGWDATDPSKPWSIATKMGGEWSTHSDFATLTKVSARYGYWVHAQGFTTQYVKLIGQIDRTDASVTPAGLVTIPTEPGWNFVGVIDQDGNQTQDNDGETLQTGVGDDAEDVTAGSYLGDNKRAYTWDAVRSEFKVLEDGDDVMIGDGIWVYYGGGIAP